VAANCRTPASRCSEDIHPLRSSFTTCAKISWAVWF